MAELAISVASVSVAATSGPSRHAVLVTERLAGVAESRAAGPLAELTLDALAAALGPYPRGADLMAAFNRVAVAGSAQSGHQALAGLAVVLIEPERLTIGAVGSTLVHLVMRVATFQLSDLGSGTFDILRLRPELGDRLVLATSAFVSLLDAARLTPMAREAPEAACARLRELAVPHGMAGGGLIVLAVSATGGSRPRQPSTSPQRAS